MTWWRHTTSGQGYQTGKIADGPVPIGLAGKKVILRSKTQGKVVLRFLAVTLTLSPSQCTKYRRLPVTLFTGYPI